MSETWGGHIMGIYIILSHSLFTQVGGWVHGDRLPFSRRVLESEHNCFCWPDLRLMQSSCHPSLRYTKECKLLSRFKKNFPKMYTEWYHTSSIIDSRKVTFSIHSGFSVQYAVNLWTFVVMKTVEWPSMVFENCLANRKPELVAYIQWLMKVNYLSGVLTSVE